MRLLHWHPPHWQRHPAVRTGSELTVGERAADSMKRWLATWSAFLTTLAAIVGWLVLGGLPAGSDNPGFLHLNLALSCFAAVQCFILLISAKRADQIASEVALHTERNTDAIKALLEANNELLKQNTELTVQVHRLTTALHDHMASSTPSDGGL